MRLKFLNRDNEKERLEKALSMKESSFCCVYGRRRCGKSRLLKEVLRGDSKVYHLCDEREPSLQRTSLASSVNKVIPRFDQVTYPDWGSLFERWWAGSPTRPHRRIHGSVVFERSRAFPRYQNVPRLPGAYASTSLNQMA